MSITNKVYYTTAMPKVHFFLGLLLAFSLGMNSWGIYRGLLFVAERHVPGLQLQKNVLVFTKTLLGRTFLSTVSQNFLNIHIPQDVFFMNYTTLFPAPNSKILNYHTGRVDLWMDHKKHVTRCARLDAIVPPDNIYFYANILMHTNGTGLRGTLCQEKFHSPNAYARMDRLCHGLACMHDQQLLGCIHRNDFSHYHIQDCARINNNQKGLHWSRTGQNNITLDDDPNMRSP